MRLCILISVVCVLTTFGSSQSSEGAFAAQAAPTPAMSVLGHMWGAPGWMDTQKHGCSMKPEVSNGRRREEAAEVLLA